MRRPGVEHKDGDGYRRVLSTVGLKRSDVFAYQAVTGCQGDGQAIQGLLELGVTGRDIERRSRCGSRITRMEAAQDVVKEYLFPQG